MSLRAHEVMAARQRSPSRLGQSPLRRQSPQAWRPQRPARSASPLARRSASPLAALDEAAARLRPQAVEVGHRFTQEPRRASPPPRARGRLPLGALQSLPSPPPAPPGQHGHWVWVPEEGPPSGPPSLALPVPQTLLTAVAVPPPTQVQPEESYVKTWEELQAWPMQPTLPMIPAVAATRSRTASPVAQLPVGLVAAPRVPVTNWVVTGACAADSSCRGRSLSPRSGFCGAPCGTPSRTAAPATAAVALRIATSGRRDGVRPTAVCRHGPDGVDAAARSRRN